MTPRKTKPAITETTEENTVSDTGAPTETSTTTEKKTRKPRTPDPLAAASKAYKRAVANVAKLSDRRAALVEKLDALDKEFDAAEVEVNSTKEALDAAVADLYGSLPGSES